MQCQKLKTYMETGRIIFLPARSIRPNPAQPRKVFREDALEELAESIRRHGILQPLSVRRVDNSYELIAGERRLRAAQLAGLTELPCLVLRMDDRESGVAAMVENLQRQDLGYIEEAVGISRLLDQWDMSQEQVARLLGKSQSAIANKLRLLKLPEDILETLCSHGLTERHARPLLRLPEDGLRREALEIIARREMTGAQTEEYIDRLLISPPKHRQKTRMVLKDVRIFLNSVTRGLDLMRRGGIAADMEKRETDKELVVTISIPIS